MLTYFGLGVRSVDSKVFGGWDGFLAGVDPDINTGASFFRMFQTVRLQNENATSAGLLASFKSFASTLKSGDILFWHQSGHGAPGIADGGAGEVKSKKNDPLDEALVLYNCFVSDNGVRRLLAMIPKGVTVITFFDTCHAGEMHRAVPRPGVTSRSMLRLVNLPSPPVADLPPSAKIKCSLIHMGACQPNETAEDLETNGRWTKTFFESFEVGMTWQEWFKAAKSRMPNWQNPVIKFENGGTKTAKQKVFMQ